MNNMKSLETILGQKLMTYMLQKTKDKEFTTTQINETVSILEQEDDQTIRNWFTGSNDLLLNQSPAKCIRENDFILVKDAAKQFVEEQ